MKMEALGIKESDLEESFTRSGGKGGQNVNKVSTAVHLKHLPSGIEVKCSVYRTQGLNRYKARSILCDRLEEKEKGEDSKMELKTEKIRKQKKRKERKRKQKIEDMKIHDLESEISEEDIQPDE